MFKATIWLIPMIFLLAISVGFANSVTIYPSDDAYTDSNYPSTNYGSTEKLIMSLSGGVYNPRFFMKFNLSSCTGINASDILDAELYYYQADAYTYPHYNINLYKISTSGYGWDESTITYNTEPASSSLIGYDSFTSCYFANPSLCLGSNGFESLTNYTTYVKSEINSGYDSINFLGKLEALGGIYSKESTNSAYKPKLVINYNGTLSCNGTGGSNSSTLQEAHMPSYIKPYSDLSCRALSSVSETVYWKIYKKELADVGFNLTWVGSGTTNAGQWTTVGTLNSSYVIPDALYYCTVQNAYITQVSNNANATQLLSLGYLTTPSDKYLYESQMQSFTVRNNGSATLYAYGECDWLSPTGLHYYPNGTEILYGCLEVQWATLPAYHVYKNMTDSGLWNGESCFVYVSTYSDCRIQDLGLQDYTLNQTNWTVTAIPSIADITISPSSPLINQTMSCSFRVLSGDNATTLDEVWSYFIVDSTGDIEKTRQTNITNNTIVTFTGSIKGYAVAGSNVSCVGFIIQKTPYVSSITYYSDNVTARVVSGSTAGQLIGNIFDVSGSVGDMMIALIVSISAMVLAVIGIANFTDNPMALGIVAIAVLISGIGIFTVAGYLPIWIILIIIILCSSIIAGMLKSSIGGGS